MKVLLPLVVLVVLALVAYFGYSLIKRAIDNGRNNPYPGVSRKQRRELCYRKYELDLSEAETAQLERRVNALGSDTDVSELNQRFDRVMRQPTLPQSRNDADNN